MPSLETRFQSGRRIATPYFRRYRTTYLLGLLLLACTNAFQIAIPWLLKTGIDALSQLEQNPDVVKTLLFSAAGIAVAAVFQAFTRVASRWFIFRAGRDVEYDIRQHAFSHVIHLDSAFYQKASRGDVISRVSNDIGNVRVLFGFGALSLINTVVAYVSALSIMMFMNWKLTLMAVAPLPLLFLVLKRFGMALHKRFTLAQETVGDLSGYLQEALHGFEVVKGFAQEEGFFRRFEEKNQANFRANMQLAWARSFMAPLMIFISGFGVFVVLAGGGYFVIKQELTIGEFVAFQGYLGMLVWPTLALGWLVNVVERGLASLVRVDELLREQPVVQDRDDARDIKLSGAIQFLPRQIPIMASDQDGFELKNISFTVDAGEKIAIVGKTGCGKSSLLRAMMRLIDVPADTIRFDGVDMTDIQLSCLRRQTGYLPQEPFLFGRTIRDALTVGLADERDESELWHVLEQAFVAQEVKDLPRGLDSRLGEKGVSMSGGQRQRMMIARLMLTDPAFVFCDSPLAAMDFVTADGVRAGIQAFCKTRTVFWATHRLERMEWFDRILLMGEGQVIAMGQHDAMLEQPLYAALYQRQQLLRALEAE